MSKDDEAGPDTRTIPRPEKTLLVGADSGRQIRVLPGDIEAAPGQRIPLAAAGDQPAADAIVMSTRIAADGPEPLRVLEVRLHPQPSTDGHS
jgi:hypothetical protein